MRMWIRWVLGTVLLLGTLSLSSCVGDNPEDGPPSDPTPEGPSGVDIDLAALFERTRLAFHPDGEGTFHGAGDAHTAEVSPEGLIRLGLASGAPGLGGRVLELGPTELSGNSTTPDVRRTPTDGSLSIEWGTFVERLENRAGDLEQSFVFPTRPSQLEIELRVPFHGMTYEATSSRGVIFGDSHGGFVYGHGTWIDASGSRTPVPVSVERGALVLRVSQAVLDQTRWPAVLDPIIGPEVRLGVPPLGPAESDETAPRVAADATGAALAWLDDRSGRVRAFATPLMSVSADVVNPLGIEIGSSSARSVDLAVSEGTALVIVQTSRELLATPISPLGVAGATVVSVSVPTSSIGRVRIAADGEQFVAVWTESVSGIAALRAARLDRAGEALVGPVSIPTTAETVRSPVIACGGIGCAVAFCAGSVGLHVLRLDAALSAIDAPPILVDAAAGPDAAPAIAAVTDGWVVSWDPPAPAGRGLVATRVAPDGSLGSVATVSSAGVADVALTVASDRVFAAWSDLDVQQLLLRELSHAGAPVGTAVAATAPTQDVRSSTIAWNGTHLIAAWSQRRTMSAPRDVRLVRASLIPSLLDPPGGIAVTNAAPPHVSAHAAWGGSSWLVVWQQDSTATLGDIYAVQVRPDGTPADPIGFPIAVSAVDEDQPEVASTGTGNGWAVVHRAGASAEGRIAFVNPSGVITSVVLTPGYSAVEPTIASSVDRYLALWGDRPVEYRRFTEGGASLDAAPRTADLGSSRPRTLLGAGTSFALAWRAGSTRIRTAQIASSGTLTPVGGADSFFGESVTGALELAFGGGTYRLAWRTPVTSGSTVAPITIRSAGLTPGATTIGPSVDVPPGWLAQGLDLVFDGTDFVTFYGRASSSDEEPWLEAVRVGIDGEFVDAVPVVLARSIDGLDLMDAASDGGHRVLLLYSGYDSPAGARRTLMRVLNMQTAGAGAILGAPCTSAWECASGFCSDGVCCNSVCGDGDTGDCGRCSVSAGAATDGTCSPRPADTTCRRSDGPCDEREVCDGSSTRCPPDALVTAGIICADATGLCDQPDVCDGVHVECQGVPVLPAGAVCRAAVGACDQPEVCDGVGAQCPLDELYSNGTECRRSAGVCDVPEVCDGESAACFPNRLRPSGTSCRGAAGPCDEPEACDGLSPSCPRDRYRAEGDVCGSADACAVAVCSGSGVSCDLRPAAAGTPCRDAIDVCDSPESCDGVALTCPTDTFVPYGTPCETEGPFCDGARVCAGGECVSGPPVVCSEGLMCSEDSRSCVPVRPGCACRATRPAGGALPWALSGLVATALQMRARTRRRRGVTPG